jgi:hypothetical protein
VCTENLIRFDYVTESHTVCDDGGTAMRTVTAIDLRRGINSDIICIATARPALY